MATNSGARARLAGRLPGAAPDSAATAHLAASTVFLVLAGGLTALMLVALRFSGLGSGLLGFGRLRGMAFTATTLGWLTLSLIGGIYYVLPRLTGAPLWRERLAGLNLAASAVVYMVAVLARGLGLGTGGDLTGLPLWIDLPVLATLAVPTWVMIQTIRHRTEEGVYVTLWYATAGLVWLTSLWAVGAIPSLTSLATWMQEALALNSFLNLWVVGVGTGLAYYVIPKAGGEPLYSRSLAQMGFWSLALAGAWTGQARYLHGLAPGWLESVASVLSLALLVAALATVVNWSASLQWQEVASSAALRTTVAGAGFYLVLTGMATAAAFPSLGALAGLTTYWDGIVYGTLFGTGGLLVAGWTYQALPDLIGRAVWSDRLARRHVRLTVVGVGGTVLLLCLGGLVAGYTWAGGSFSGAFIDAGEGFQNTLRATAAFHGLAALTGLVAFAGQLAFAFNVYRTFTSGRPVPAEMLVMRDPGVPEAHDE